MNKATINNQIFSKSQNQSRQSWVFAIIWNAAIWYAIVMGGEKILQAFDENPIFYLFVTFPFIGIWLFIYSIKETRAWYKFGKTPLVINPFPGQIGGRFSGSLDLPIAIDDAQQANFSLSCVHGYYTKDNRGRSNWYEQTVWQDIASFKPEYRGEKTRIDFLFTTPSDLPASENESNDYHFWQLHVHLPLPGIDYDRVFKVPMELASTQQLASTERYTAKVSPRIAYQDTDISKVPKINNSISGLQFYYGYGRSIGMALFLLIFGISLAAFGYFFFDGFLDFLPATMGLMAAFIGLIAFIFCFIGILLMANSLTVEVSLMGIRKKQRFFGFLFEEFTDAQDIVDIQVEQNASSDDGKNKRVWYKLNLITANNQNMELGDSLEGQSYANEIKQKMIDALGSNWRAATLIEKKDSVKKPLPLWLRRTGKVFSYSFVFTLIYDVGRMSPQISEFLSGLFTLINK